MLFIFMLCLCLFHFFFICIMHSAFNLFVFPNSMFTSLLFLFFIFLWKGYELSGEIALTNSHYYYYGMGNYIVLVRNDCFWNAHRLLYFVSKSRIVVRLELLTGLCWHNDLFVMGYFHDMVVQISLCATVVFIDSSVVKYLFLWFL